MKPYRAALLLVRMFLPAVAICLAAHPLEGTWKLNATQSRIAPNQPDAPKEGMMVLRLIGDQFELTDKSTLKDGTASSASHPALRDGRPATFSRSDQGVQ